MEDTSCPASLDSHIDEAFAALVGSGMGGACETAYHAILEIAEVIRSVHNYKPYTPVKTAEILNKSVGDLPEQAWD